MKGLCEVRKHYLLSKIRFGELDSEIKYSMSALSEVSQTLQIVSYTYVNFRLVLYFVSL